MKKIITVTILFSCFLLSTSLYSYSLFSGAGLGEPVYTSPRISEFGISENLSFECSFRGEFVTTMKGEQESQVFNFSFPCFSYFLPLPKKSGIELSLSELLNLNYEIESDTVEYDTVHNYEVKHIVKSKGSANTFNIGIGKNIGCVDIMGGCFVVFGSAIEEWTNDFINVDTTYDTLELKFEGKGGIVCIGATFGNLKFNGRYFTESGLISGTKLPARFNIGAGWTLNKFKISGDVESWQWKGKYDGTIKYSVGVEWNGLYLGGYTANWYYGNIEEKAGCVGLKIPFKTLCDIKMDFELGQRGEMCGLEEEFYRMSLTLLGKEEL